MMNHYQRSILSEAVKYGGTNISKNDQMARVVESNGIAEARKMGKKQLEKAANDAFRKYFDRVQVSIMKLGAIYKDIEAAIVSGADLDKVMPELIKKYGIAESVEIEGGGELLTEGPYTVIPYPMIIKGLRDAASPFTIQFVNFGGKVLYKYPKEINSIQALPAHMDGIFKDMKGKNAVLGWHRVNILGKDGKVVNSIAAHDVPKRRTKAESVEVAEADKTAFKVGSGAKKRMMSPKESVTGYYALYGFYDNYMGDDVAGLEVILSKSDTVIGMEHYRMRMSNAKQIGRTGKLGKNLSGKPATVDVLMQMINNRLPASHRDTFAPVAMAMESVEVAEAAAPATPTHGYKVGDILFGSTYYGMIIPHFYKVTRLIGATKIEVVELTLQQNGDGWSGQATPSGTPKSAAKIFTVRKSGGADPGIKINNYLTAQKWDGRAASYNYLD